MIEKIKTWLNLREYKKNIKVSIFSSIYLFLSNDGLDKRTDKALPHPLNSVRLPKYFEEVSKLPFGCNVSFGDSLVDLSREQMDIFDGIFNISGQWAEHTMQTIMDLCEVLLLKQPKNIGIGCLGGNPMLVYQNYEYVKRTTIECLDYLRIKFPYANIIVYGCPPNYSINVTRHAIEYEELVKNWTINNSAKFISLYELLKGFFPKAKHSSDGIHLTEYGAWKLNKKIGELCVR